MKAGVDRYFILLYFLGENYQKSVDSQITGPSEFPGTEYLSAYILLILSLIMWCTIVLPMVIKFENLSTYVVDHNT
jgi:TnpA family transposase